MLYTILYVFCFCPVKPKTIACMRCLKCFRFAKRVVHEKLDHNGHKAKFVQYTLVSGSTVHVLANKRNELHVNYINKLFFFLNGNNSIQIYFFYCCTWVVIRCPVSKIHGQKLRGKEFKRLLKNKEYSEFVHLHVYPTCYLSFNFDLRA